MLQIVQALELELDQILLIRGPCELTLLPQKLNDKGWGFFCGLVLCCTFSDCEVEYFI
jgi:hypothetical protein